MIQTTNILQGFIQRLPEKINNPQKEEGYIKEMKENPEIWQLFQEVYRTWKIENKEELTQKSKFLTAIKESINE